MLNHADEAYARFRERLAKRKPVFGIALTTAETAFAEIAAETGFDFAWIETEHTTISLAEVEHLVIALENRGCVPLVRVRTNEPNIIGQTLDMGARIVNIPHVDTVDEARQAVAAAKYYPMGRRGYASTTRSTRRGFDRLDIPFMTRKNAETMLMVQIESVKAVENADAIAALDGVDALFVGYADLCQDMGIAPDPKHPDCAHAIRDVGAAIRRHGKQGMFIAADPADIPYYADLGFRMIVAGMDTRLFGNAAAAVFRALADSR